MSTRHYQGVFQEISTSRLPLEKFHLFVFAYFYSHLKCAGRTSAVSREGLALAVCKCPCRRTVRQQRTSPPAVCPANHSADYSNELFHVLCVFYLQWLLFKSRLIGGSHLVVDRRAAPRRLFMSHNYRWLRWFRALPNWLIWTPAESSWL